MGHNQTLMLTCPSDRHINTQGAASSQTWLVKSTGWNKKGEKNVLNPFNSCSDDYK